MNRVPPPPDGNMPLPDIAGYRLLGVLGTGGMSTVYLGEQTSLSRQVAIKVMRPEALADEVSRRRFENEARTIARLEHPHIVGIHEVGRTREGLPYYAMPHLPRGHLGQRIHDEHGATMDQARVRGIVQALLSALGYAHARGTVHRDVKAENVLFDEAERPLLADFGIALRRGYGTRVTTAGLAVGSTAYMAPEQARGEEVDQRADLYSLGVLTWEMLTGELPYNAGDALSMAVMHVKDPIPRLPPRLRHWQRFMDRALAKSPARRFRDTRHMHEALDKVPRRDHTREMPVLPALRRGAGFLRHMPKLAWVGLLLLAAGAIGMYLRDDGGAAQDTSRRGASSSATTASPSIPQSPAEALPAPATKPGQATTTDPADALLRAAPASSAERWVVAADRQIRANRLTSPGNDNAYDSLLAAQKSDASYLALPAATERFIDAIGNDALRRIADNDIAQAGSQVAAAMRVAERTRQTTSPAVVRLRANVVRALELRIDAAAADYDHAAAAHTAANAKALGVDADETKRLAALAERIPKPGERIADAAGLVLVRDGDARFGAMSQPVSRDDYTRFANATHRGEALCRDRASLLRIVSPRDWKSPGFAQVGSQPVVCVSWDDAQAYARWRSGQDGRQYRLPNALEAKSMPAPVAAARAISEWANDCSGDCEHHLANGRSWRTADNQRPLEGDRGYDDVGIRLVSDLPRRAVER